MNWQDCKNILCIRPDNMGDVLMTVPAIRALKETFGARITLLTSSMAKGVVKYLPEIDEAIIFDLPWVKAAETADRDSLNDVVSTIKQKKFDAAVIFTVYSQNPLPNAMLAYLAGIPKILAYCRENPYHLLTDWVPDKEPYDVIKHQVRRDLDLVAAIGAKTQNEALHLNVDENLWPQVKKKLQTAGVDTVKPWLLLHAGVSEKKREYLIKHWAPAGKKLIEKGYQLVLTGSAAERGVTDKLEKAIGLDSFSASGLFSLDEFICLIKHAPLLLSVNTGTVHIAAAVGTPVIVLYAQTNPQHTPWGVPNKVLTFPVPAYLRSSNEVIKYVNKTLYSKPTGLPTVIDIVNAVDELLSPSGLPAQPFREIPSGNQAIAAS
ncbi:glycosyltransferase family 9 protein [Mucilaginibacter sp.]|jgi:ADP-heptose:LPS heptosyltransferase|uniref:glycosyltransferase family 9 protein n=1 Tax=Mucilaginibacter sp. TaxID=1882438 RepID=UPI00261F8D05|nr:glycosyltransferase family 9 protein [Mucilaginibacter sp.]MDB5127265.1 glycosyl transferase family 9 [Mucilaginibacter sp.]